MIMDRKKLLGAALASTAALVISATAFAALNEASAKELAQKWVPEGAAHVLTKADKLGYEVEFFDKETNVTYEVELNKLTEAVTEIKTKLRNNPGSKIINLNEEDVKSIVRSEFPDANIQKIKLDSENGYQQYEVNFTDGAIRGEMSINPETGVIIERELDY